MNTTWTTKATLIQRAISRSDEEAWTDFANYYLPFIQRIIYKITPDLNDTQDIQQAILIKLWQKLPLFNTEGPAKFRTWLYIIIRNILIDHLRKQKRVATTFCSDQSTHPELSVDSEIEKMIDREWKLHISTLAMQAVEKRFSGKTMKIFYMAMDNTPVEQICSELEVSADTVYSLKNRVKTFLVKQIKELRHELEI